jgi:ABC-type transport system involved in cytochrome bd biosynthesis fused ATPase/permease subunit
MGAVFFLLFRMRSSGSSGDKARGAGSSLDTELLKVKKTAENLELKKVEIDKLGAQLIEKQDRLESVIGKVEAVIDTLGVPLSVGAAGSSISAEPSRGKTLAMAREMLGQGKSVDEITAKLDLYRGEVELLTSLEKLSSD